MLGDAGDLQLIDPSGYFLAQRGQLMAASSVHLYFDQDMTAFRWTLRLGGHPYMSAPITDAQGSAATISHFTSVAARA